MTMSNDSETTADTAPDDEVLRVAREVTERRQGLMERLAKTERCDAENDVRDEWGVIGPEGRMWTYESEVVARTVANEQQKHLHHRTVTRCPWERVTPPA